MAKTLREQLIGAWKLMSYIEKPMNGSDPVYPREQKQEGILVYTADGYMSAHLMQPERQKFASGDWSCGTDEEIKGAALGYFAYAGPFYVDEERQTLTHEVFLSLDPNWVGQSQIRVAKIEDDILHLSTEKPIKRGASETMYYLAWKRVERP